MTIDNPYRQPGRSLRLEDLYDVLPLISETFTHDGFSPRGDPPVEESVKTAMVITSTSQRSGQTMFSERPTNPLVLTVWRRKK